VVVQDATTRRALAEAANNQSFVGEAPAVVVCCAAAANHTMPCGIKSFAVDVAIAIDHLTLAAVAEGLGTCWIGAFDPDAVKGLLGIPKEITIVELMPLGYPTDPQAKEKNRLSLEETVKHERW
jgi:nitroreductase